jgi:hypothetical protein
MMGTNVSFKIFISYSTVDLPEVNLLQQQLRDTPIGVFVAEYSVLPGEELAPRIAKEIQECDLFVFLWSGSAKSSDWVSQEIGRACALDKQILPLVLSESTQLPGFIQGLKYLPVHKDPQGSLQQARSLILAAYQKKKDGLLATDLAPVQRIR